jgi:hypothetical protein
MSNPNLTHAQFAAIPDTAMNDITAPGTPASGGNTGNPDPLASEINEAGKHTQSGGTATPGSAAAAEPPGTTVVKKSLSQLTAGKGGKFGTRLLDMIIPALICFGAAKAGYRLDKRTFKLTADEREFMEPAMQELLDSLYVDMSNPWAQFALVFGMIYGGKLLDAIPDAEKRRKPDNKDSDSNNSEPATNWEDEYNEQLEKLVADTAKRSKKSYNWAREHVQSTGKAESLRNKIIQKYQSKLRPV